MAGYVDAIGFIKLGGFFVSFMSGNSTRIGVGLAEGSANALVAAGLVAAFVSGVAAGSLVGHWAGGRRRPAVLILVCGLLARGASLGGVGAGPWAGTAMALAMGAENAVFAEKGEVSIGLTYMTGTLVKLGQRIAQALMGGDRLGWAPYAGLWLGLLLGGLGGALAYRQWGLGALWIAVAATAALAATAERMGPDGAARTSVDV